MEHVENPVTVAFRNRPLRKAGMIKNLLPNFRSVAVLTALQI